MNFVLQWQIFVFCVKICMVYRRFLNNKMLSLLIHAGYEGRDIAEKIHNFFHNGPYLHNPLKASKISIYIFVVINY